MAASLIAPNVTSMCPSLLIFDPLLSAQLAGDRREALLRGFLGRVVRGLRLDEPIAYRLERRVELRSVLVPTVLQDLEAGRGRALPRAHQRVEPREQRAELRLDLRVDVVNVLSRHMHRGELRSKIRTGSAHAPPPFGDPAEGTSAPPSYARTH